MRNLGSFILVAGAAGLIAMWAIRKPQEPVRIGYFHGGRTNMIYRTSVSGFFDKEGVSVELYTKNLSEREAFRLPKTFDGTRKVEIRSWKGGHPFGKIRGTEIVDAMVSGRADGGTIGEASFIKCVHDRIPIVAVALLGFDTKEHPGHAILLRKDVVIRSPADFHGKTLTARRAGPGDYIFLMEFLRTLGLDKDKTIKVIAQVNDDKQHAMLRDRSTDGGYFHLLSVIGLVEVERIATVYRPLNWLNPKMSQALLVFRKDYVEKHAVLVQKIVDAYVKRIAYEKSLKADRVNKSLDIGLMMQTEYRGMMIPQYDLPPLIAPEYLEGMQELLLRYGFVHEKKDLRPFIDNRFVEESMKKLNASKS